MNYIFRYTIITHYTSNPSSLTHSDLLAALKSQNFNLIDRLDSLIDLCRTTITTLLKNTSKMGQQAPEACKQIISDTMGKQIGVAAVQELVNVWQTEKIGVYGGVLAQACGSVDKWVGVNWGVTTQVSAKGGRRGEKNVVISVNSRDNQGSLCKTTVQMNKSKLAQMTSVLLAAAEFLDHNLK